MTADGFFGEKVSGIQFFAAHDREVKSFWRQYANYLRACMKDDRVAETFGHHGYFRVMSVFNLAGQPSEELKDDIFDAVSQNTEIQRIFQVDDSVAVSELIYHWKHGESSLPSSPEAVRSFMSLIAGILEARAPTVEAF